MTRRTLRLELAASTKQGSAKRVLCVCKHGLHRSATAAHLLFMAYGHNTRAVGIDPEHSLIALDDVLLGWADEIVCMDEEQREEVIMRIHEADLPNKPIQNLDIEDCFPYMNTNLQSLIINRYKEA